MLLSELHKQIAEAPEDSLTSSVFLASPETDEGAGVDVYAIGILEADVDRDRNEIRLIPRSSSDPAGDTPFFFLSMLMEKLPSDTVLWGDFEILAELPLDRDSKGGYRKAMTKVHALHMGLASGEAWFLVRPPSEYAKDVLPE